MNNLKSYFTLCRVTVSLFAACSAATGYFIMPGNEHAGAVIPFFAVFLLACGASALNQYQEQDIDGLMERTRRRPLPSGTMSPAHALLVSIFLILSGAVLLALGDETLPLVIGLAAVVWYNGVYTYFKRRTAFAAVPGALVGAIPPAIGWASAGGDIADPRLLVLCTLFFMWQIPHSWLMMLSHNEDYERAELPSLVAIFGRERLGRIAFTWIASTAVLSLSIPASGVLNSYAASVGLVPVAAWFVWRSRGLFRTSAYTDLLRGTYLYILSVMAVLSLDSLAGSAL